MKNWKKVVSVALASTLMLGLCACNKETGAGGGEAGKKNENANSSLAKEYVYSMDEFDFDSIGNGNDCSVQKIAKAGDKLYMVMSIYDENWDNTYKLVEMKEDGTDMQIINLQLSTSQETGEETEKATESTGNQDGGATAIQPRAAESTVIDNTATDVAEMDDSPNTYESTNLAYFMFRDDRFYAQKTYYFEDYSDPENYVSINENTVCCWDLKGNIIWETPIELNSDDGSWSYINTMAILPSGKVAVLINGDKNGIIEVSSDGRASDLKVVEDLEKFFTNSSYTATTSDGRLLVSYYNDDWTEMSVAFYDFQKGSMSESFPVPATMTYNGLSNLSVDEQDDLLYTNGQGVFKYHIGDKEPKQLMSFVNSDLNISYLDAFLYLDDSRFVGVYSVYDDVTYKRTLEGGIFTKVNPEDIPDKEVITLGGNYVSNDVKKRVIAYNKSSQTHRIVIKEYSQYNTNEDYKAGVNQLNNDIIAGNMPDILIVDSYNMSLENYVSKGLLADIGELMANDSELSGNKYMENVFEACKVNGKLYEVIPSFYISSYMGKASLIGERENWTMEDAQAVLAKMPEGASLFGDMTRDSFFNIVIEMCGRDFVDVSTGKCNFNSEEFIALMEFAKTLPQELGDDYYGENWYANYESQYRENRTLLANCYLSSMENMVYSINGSFGEDVSFVGMPTSSGQGSILYTPNTYAISAKSGNIDIAWEFVRYYLTDEYQNTLEWQLPISKERFDEVAQKATRKPVYTDENGNEVEEDYTYWINDESVVLDPLTQDQVNYITEFVSSVTTRAYYNEDISNIISEEMEAFYQDQKSAKDVAGIIQSRVQLFVNENR